MFTKFASLIFFDNRAVCGVVIFGGEGKINMESFLRGALPLSTGQLLQAIWKPNLICFT